MDFLEIVSVRHLDVGDHTTLRVQAPDVRSIVRSAAQHALPIRRNPGERYGFWMLKRSQERGAVGIPQTKHLVVTISHQHAAVVAELGILDRAWMSHPRERSTRSTVPGAYC